MKEIRMITDSISIRDIGITPVKGNFYVPYYSYLLLFLCRRISKRETKRGSTASYNSSNRSHRRERKRRRSSPSDENAPTKDDEGNFTIITWVQVNL